MTTLYDTPTRDAATEPGPELAAGTGSGPVAVPAAAGAPAPRAHDEGLRPRVPARRTPPARARLYAPSQLDNVAAVVLAGELDDAASSGATTLEVDLSRVRDMQPLAARVLLRQHWRLQPRGGAVVVREPSPAARRTLRWAAASELLPRTAR